VKKIKNALKENIFLTNTDHTCFTMLIESAVDENENLHHLKNIEYAHGIIKYPYWGKDSDLFEHLDPNVLTRLQNKEIFFVFDASTEGYSPLHGAPFFDILYHNVEKYNVDPCQIIFTSSNLKDETNLINYTLATNKKPFNVFSFPAFELVVNPPDNYCIRTEEEKRMSIEDVFQKKYHLTKDNYNSKYFLSLSRLNRLYRTMGTFLLWSDPIKDKALISHDKLNITNPLMWLQTCGLGDHSVKDFRKFCKRLPFIIDRTDFQKNWAIETPYEHLHAQTLFQIVNETHQEDWYGTSMFYSEKTFKPVANFQPFVIFGQQHCNKFMQHLGYKSYEQWFDMSFDDESNIALRYKKLLKSVKEACREIDSMPVEKHIEWKFQNKEILIHNYQTMINNSYAKKKIKNWLEIVFND
jgi:hypothetical protein